MRSVWLERDLSKCQGLKCVLDESDADFAACCRKVMSGRKILGAIRSLVNTLALQLECVRLLHETLLVHICCMTVKRKGKV